MSDYQSNLTLADAGKLIMEAGDVLITTHVKPDGDAFGSVVALAAALKQLGRNFNACLMPPVPANFAALRGNDLVNVLEGPWTGGDPALVVVLDTGAWAQLTPLRPLLELNLQRTLIIDHHLTGDLPAAHRYVDGQAASCCEVVAELVEVLGRVGGDGNANALFDPTVCESLFVGVASDTGWFRFANTRAQTHELAARLQRAGVDQADIYRKLEQAERPEKLALLIRALRSLQLLADGRVALMVLRSADFADTGARVEETERFVDVPQAVEQVEVVVLVTEPPAEPGDNAPAIRVSFRSKPGNGDGAGVNVAALAGQFGGGGHARAAGAKFHTTLDEALEQLKTAVTNAVNAHA